MNAFLCCLHIEAGKKITQNMIDEQNHKDLLSLDAMKEYFKGILRVSAMPLIFRLMMQEFKFR